MVTVNKGFNHPFYILFKKEGAFPITDAPLANWQGKGKYMGYINLFERKGSKMRERGKTEREEGRKRRRLKKKKKKEPERIRNEKEGILC